jgi:hypothetical protein
MHARNEGLSGSVYRQTRMTEEQKEEAISRHQAYMEKLNLTEAQKPKVEEINKKYFESLSNLKETNGSRLAKYKTFKSLSSARDQEMKKILTNEQYEIAVRRRPSG